MRCKKTELLLMPLFCSGELQIDEQGRIWRYLERRTGGELYPVPIHRAEWANQLGYLCVQARLERGRATALAHRLVYTVLYGEIPDGMTVNHKNGDKKDNQGANLELMTQRQQIQHSRDVLGTRYLQAGIGRSREKLTAAQVFEIRRLVGSGVSLCSLVAVFGVSLTTLSLVAQSRTWKHLPTVAEILDGAVFDPSEPRHPTRNTRSAGCLNAGTAEEMRVLFGKGISAKDLSASFSVSVSTVYLVLKGRTWKEA